MDYYTRLFKKHTTQGGVDVKAALHEYAKQFELMFTDEYLVVGLEKDNPLNTIILRHVCGVEIADNCAYIVLPACIYIFDKELSQVRIHLRNK